MLAVNVIKRLLNFKRLNQLNDQFSDRPLERVREAINLGVVLTPPRYPGQPPLYCRGQENIIKARKTKSRSGWDI